MHLFGNSSSCKYSREVRNRNLEWFFVSSTIVLGFWMLLPFETMSTGAFETLLTWVSETTWGFGFLVLGLAHGVALKINGRAWWTPIIRLVTVSCGAMIYALFSAGFALVYYGTSAVPVYAMMCGGLIFCSIVAARDAEYARGIRHGSPNA